MSKKVQSRTSAANKSLNRASSSKKRGVSNIKISGNSRNKSSCFGDSKAEHVRQLNGKKENSISYMVPGINPSYANNYRPISIKKNIRNSKLNKGLKMFKDMRTRNPKSSIFKTSDFDSQLITNQSFQKGKKIDSRKIKRVKKNRGSTSNSKSKTKHKQEYTSKPRAKVSSRTDSKFTGPLYTTFYQKHNDAITSTFVRDSNKKESTRRKNSIKDVSKKISMNAVKLVKYKPSVKSGSMFSN
jgi:hypothetical protein